MDARALHGPDEAGDQPEPGIIVWDDLIRRAYPMTEGPPPVLIHPSRARFLTCDLCPVQHARDLIAEWHSRLPKTQRGPWQYAMRAHYHGFTYAVALWHNPSARMLPQHWLELRRMAVSEDAPHCTASWFIGAMTRWFREHCPERERLLSYQDLDVHKGTIYKAANWHVAHTSKPRVRDRSGIRAGTKGRMYRSNLNGVAPDGAGKARWEYEL